MTNSNNLINELTPPPDDAFGWESADCITKSPPKKDLFTKLRTISSQLLNETVLHEEDYRVINQELEILKIVINNRIEKRISK